MLEPHSVDQILRVLEFFRQNKRLGFDTGSACSRAIQQVAKESNVRYQTIGDGCRRRLGLVDMSEFHRLIEDWLRGNARPLAVVLKQNSAKSVGPRIDAFFADQPRATKRADDVTPGLRTGPVKVVDSNPVRITLSDTDSRMLRVLAQIEDRQPDMLGVELLSAGVRERLRAAIA